PCGLTTVDLAVDRHLHAPSWVDVRVLLDGKASQKGWCREHRCPAGKSLVEVEQFPGKGMLPADQPDLRVSDRKVLESGKGVVDLAVSLGKSSLIHHGRRDVEGPPALISRFQPTRRLNRDALPFELVE